MKKYFTLFSFFLLFLNLHVAAQSIRSTPVTLINDIQISNRTFTNLDYEGKNAGTCGYDTVYYPYYKSTAFNAVALNATSSGSGFAQWFPTPQSLNISGFDFYAWQSAGTASIVTITCNIYQSSADSLPQGSPIRSVTVQIDSTFRGGLLSMIRKHARFASPAIVTSPNGYVVTLETSSSTNVSVICNNYAATSPDGRSEWLSSVRLNGVWISSDKVNVGGRIFDADFIFKPTVSYGLTADFTVNECNNQGNLVTFTNTSSPIIFSKFYSLYAYYNFPQICFMWDYGDTTWITYNINGSRNFNHRVNYMVSLKDTLYGWTKGCSDKIIKTVYATPLPPVIQSNEPLCSGSELLLTTDSFTGHTYSWSGPKGFSSKTINPARQNSDTSMNGEYMLKLDNHGCRDSSIFTVKNILQTPQKPSAVNDGSKCESDSAFFEASSPSPGIRYHWSGPNGFSSDSMSFSFYDLDTTSAGAYSVSVEDGNCYSDTASVFLYIYPPPQKPELFSTSDSICAGDTIFLNGLSVTGALFDWTGPGSFTSSETNPVIPRSDNSHSGRYFAKVIIGSCTSPGDSLDIVVLDLPVTSNISGNDTSTEKLLKTYTAAKGTGSELIWSVTGGTVENTNAAAGTVTIKWGNPGTGKVSVTEKNDVGCFGETKDFNVTILSEPPPPNQVVSFSSEKIRVYPNPAAEQLIIKRENASQETIGFKLVDIHGREMTSGVLSAGDSSHTLDVKYLSPGIYILQLSTAAGNSSVRVVVK